MPLAHHTNQETVQKPYIRMMNIYLASKQKATQVYYNTTPHNISNNRPCALNAKTNKSNTRVSTVRSDQSRSYNLPISCQISITLKIR